MRKGCKQENLECFEKIFKDRKRSFSGQSVTARLAVKSRKAKQLEKMRSMQTLF